MAPTIKQDTQTPFLGRSRRIQYMRNKRVFKDTIHGITRPAIRRMARRGGVCRIAHPIYDDMRAEARRRVTEILREVVALVEHSGRKTVQVYDVVYALKRLGTPVYGFGDVTKAGKMPPVSGSKD